MFKNKKSLKEIEEKISQLKKEKQELLKIKEILEDKTSKIDIKDVYIFSVDGINYIVRLQVDKRPGKNYFGIPGFGNYSKVIDIFSNKIIYEKFSYKLIEREEYIGDRKNDFYLKDNYAYLKPIVEVDTDLLAYPNLLVPEYVLINLYYKLNKVDVNSDILTRKTRKVI